MTATKDRLGRDPELHVIHETKAAADAYIGKPGQITLAKEVPGGPLKELRAHDGLTKGGYVVQLAASGSMAAMLPPALVVPPLTLTVPDTAPFTVFHQLGYTPLVQAIDDTGAVAEVVIEHVDNETVLLTFAAAGDYQLILR